MKRLLLFTLISLSLLGTVWTVERVEQATQRIVDRFAPVVARPIAR